MIGRSDKPGAIGQSTLFGLASRDLAESIGGQVTVRPDEVFDGALRDVLTKDALRDRLVERQRGEVGLEVAGLRGENFAQSGVVGVEGRSNHPIHLLVARDKLGLDHKEDLDVRGPTPRSPRGLMHLGAIGHHSLNCQRRERQLHI